MVFGERWYFPVARVFRVRSTSSTWQCTSRLRDTSASLATSTPCRRASPRLKWTSLQPWRSRDQERSSACHCGRHGRPDPSSFTSKLWNRTVYWSAPCRFDLVALYTRRSRLLFLSVVYCCLYLHVAYSQKSDYTKLWYYQHCCMEQKRGPWV